MFNYLIYILTLIALTSMLTLSLNIITGYVGYLNLGHVGFWAIGSYTFSILALKGVPFFIALGGGGIAAGIAGFILGLPTLRLKSHYIAITSLGFLFIVNSLLINLSDITRGPLGLLNIPRPHLFGYGFENNNSFFVLTLTVCGILGFIIHRILNSPFGKILETIREDEIAAKALGKNTYAYKLQAFVISAFFTGIFGGMTSSFFTFIFPSGFFIPQAIFFLAAVMIGGAGSFWGSIVGTIFLMTLEEITRFIPMSPNAIGPVRTMIYALILMMVMIYRPNGILKRVKK